MLQTPLSDISLAVVLQGSPATTRLIQESSSNNWQGLHTWLAEKTCTTDISLNESNKDPAG